MNSLNLLSSRVIGQSATERPGNYRRRSFSEGRRDQTDEISRPKRSASQHVKRESSTETLGEKDAPESDADPDKSVGVATPPTEIEVDEKIPTIDYTSLAPKPSPKYYKLHLAARKLVRALVRSIQFVLSTIATPGVYVASCLYEDNGAFSPFRPVRTFARVLAGRGGSKSTAQAVGLSASPNHEENRASSVRSVGASRRTTGIRAKGKKPNPTPPGTASEVDSNDGSLAADDAFKPQLSSSSDEATPIRRSIRIKLHNEDSARKRKVKRTAKPDSAVSSSTKQEPPLTVATIKSPTSPPSSLRMTKYPRAPAPPRPLIPPQHLPSRSPSSRSLRKTLVIDLDETLIHSLAKGGRMSSGHMVEVKLNTAVGYGGTTLGPQHPILYYVHKRPHCDDFLRTICKWYDLVVFTASVQEYADPVIDWLELEYKYFAKRYYRQHCTFRNGAYIKDLSSVEPDLSKVMIIDNSPLSYIFHEGKAPASCNEHGLDYVTDNAIPIEGWINDPTDNDLLHLIPLLEALQYVMDVRALLALRRGEVEASH
ncbi:MAG: hypothetical protein Q9174_000455 [Haloplaca sp. 1 TL-2023]